MPFGPPRGEWQDRVKPIQGLNSRFLIHAKDSRMLRWIHIQSNDVGGLLLKLRIIAGHVSFESMGFEFGPHQHALHSALTQAQRRGQFSTRPVGTSVRWFLLSASKNAGLYGRCDGARLTPFMLPLQPSHA